MARRRGSGRPPSERSCSRLARHGRNSIERMLDRGAYGDAAVALMDAFGIEELGMEQLDLTPGCVERARAERGEAPLA